MIVFALGALALIAATLAFLLWPLMREARERGAADAAGANAIVLKDQLAELERDRASGTIDAADYDEAHLELKRRLLEDTAVVESPASAPGRRPWAAVATAVALPVAAAGLYLTLGNPAALDPEERQARLGPADVEAMVAKLAQRLESRPDDLEGWAMLGRSYKVLGRNEEAARAYAKAGTLIAGDPRLLIDYAEALALGRGGDLQGKPAELVGQALALDPGYPPALMLAGAIAYQRTDFRGAVREWEKALARVAPESQEARVIGETIARARELAAAAPDARSTAKPAQKAAKSPVAAGGRVAGTVRLAPALAPIAAPTDTVFIFARAVGGPPAPLAVVRRQVKDLPFEFSLDDTMAMAPERKLSGAAEIVVGARISRSGNAMPQSGDLQGVSRPVKVGASGVAVVIDTAVP